MDLELIEKGDGGELIQTPNDLSIIDGFENMVYLAMFGGNVKQSTPKTRLSTDQDFSWWGNNLLDPGDESLQFNSETERALNTVPLTSSGRNQLQKAVDTDLAFMKDFATVIVNVLILDSDKVVLGVRLIQPDKLQKQDFIYIWDATKKELLDRELFGIVSTSTDFFDFTFDVFFN
jgi:hypothetical protein